MLNKVSTYGKINFHKENNKMYNERLRRNFKAVIENHGIVFKSREEPLKSITTRHIRNIVDGTSSITVKKLEEISDEIGADMMDFFQL